VSRVLKKVIFRLIRFASETKRSVTKLIGHFDILCRARILNSPGTSATGQSPDNREGKLTPELREEDQEFFISILHSTEFLEFLVCRGTCVFNNQGIFKGNSSPSLFSTR